MIYTLDDDESFNMILKKALQNFGFEVKTHTSSEKFISSIKEKTPEMCIIDLNLNIMGEGFTMLMAMRKVIGDKLPVIVMSKRSDNIDVKKVMEIGADDFLPKPLDDRYLALKLQHFFPNNDDLKRATISTFPVLQSHTEGMLCHPGSLKRIEGHRFEFLFAHYYPQGTDLKISGEFATSMFGKDSMVFRVIETIQDVESKSYITTVSREFSREEFYAIKRWLLANLKMKQGSDNA
mgnify:CR=1 FL=1